MYFRRKVLSPVKKLSNIFPFSFSKKKMNVQSVCHLFEILFHVLKMLEEENHLDYCYCNEKKTQCWLCKFSEYVKYNNLKNHLLRYRQNESQMLDIAEKFWFYIKKIKKEAKQLNVDSIKFYNFTD